MTESITNNKTEKITIALCLLIAVGFAIASVIQRNDKLPNFGRELNVSSNEIIGKNPIFLNESHGSFVLVEFGDYECPPCRASVHPLNQLLKLNNTSVRFVFRNYPLTTIHPYSYDAAVLAEIAKEKGRFSFVHDALYADKVDANRLKHVASEFQLESIDAKTPTVEVAKSRVDADMRFAQSIGLSGTPTFVLCLPNGRVVQLSGLDMLSSAIKEFG
ncbi:MAG: thioredoxin domain-containing protein [Capsulimonas sp.]|uniref:DsbA family protein n=1 Tax=Capsulimonas sp. TaxID=2494211 RepID=UPI003265DA8B